MKLKTTLCSTLASVFFWSASAIGAPPLDLRTLDKKACSRPIEQRLTHAARAFVAAERVNAGVAPNPRIEAQHLRTLDGPKDRETIVGVAIPIVVSGRRGVLRDAANARGREAEAMGRARRFEAVMEARRLFAHAVLEEARVEVIHRQQRELDSLATTVAKLARGGEAAEYDALRQSVEARTHRRSLARARAQAAASKRALEAWLDEPVTLPVLDRSGLIAANSRTNESSEHPSIAGLRASAQASELEARAARWRSIPDPEFFAGYRQLDVEGATGRGFALGLSVPLPLFDHGQGEARRAGASALRTRATLASEARRLETVARAESARLQVLEGELGRTLRLVKDADGLRDGARKLYAAGEASVAELLDAYRAAESAELERLDIIEAIAIARIDQARATGSGAVRGCGDSP